MSVTFLMHGNIKNASIQSHALYLLIIVSIRYKFVELCKFR